MNTTSHRSTSPIAALFCCALLGTAVFGQSDYTVAPVKPDLARDAETTFLADFSKAGNPVVHAGGDRRIDSDKAQRVADGGISGAFTLPTRGNFNPLTFTIEMILRVPTASEASGNTSIARWEVNQNYNVIVRLDSARMYGRSGWAGRDKEFQLVTSYSGNGWGIMYQAKGQWVYLAFGVDMTTGRSNAIVRDMEGHVLLRRNELMSEGSLLNIADDADAAARWQSMAKSIRVAGEAGQPAAMTFGAPGVDLRAVRLSRTFREDILLPAPAMAVQSMTQWSARDLDPKRTVVEKVSRSLGFGGYRNAKSFVVDESHVPLRAGDEAITIPLKDMKIGLYTMHLYGTIDPAGREKLDRVWKPCPIEFELLNAKGERVANGRRLAKQDFSPTRLQGFHLHIDHPGDYTVRLRVGERAQETARILRIAMVDDLAGLPDQAVKSRQTMVKPEATMRQLSSLDQARKDRDDLIWNTLPPLNIHLQVHGQVKPFTIAPKAANLPSWQTAAFAGKSGYAQGREAINRLDFINMQTKEIFPQEKILAGEPWPGPHADDGTGIFLTKSEFPELPHDIYLAPRAEMLGRRVQLFVGLLGAWDARALSIPAKYFESGDPQLGHDGAMALVRVAYDWPALEMNLHEQRLATHSPDFEFNTDWSQRRNGKYFYEGWSGNMQVDFMTAYDQLFPYIHNNQAFADAVNRFIPWVKTPRDVIAFLDRFLVFAGVRDFNRGLIRAAPVEDFAARLLGPHPTTESFFDLTVQHAEIYPYKGTYQELYASALSRSGSYHIGSFMVYAFGSAQDTVIKAALLADAKRQGVKLKMDLSDVNRYTKVRAAGDFLLDMWVAGGFPFMVGDASGGPHTGIEAPKRMNMAADAIREMFRLTGSQRHAWVLKNMLGDKSPEVAKAAEGQRDPIVHNRSRVVADYGAILEMNPDESDLSKKTAATLRLGVAQGHAHSDYLDLNLFAMGLPMAVDLACRNEGSNWSRPGAAWAFLHNHAIAHSTDNPASAGGQNGEPWLRSFEHPLVRASYVDGRDKVRLDRDVFIMSVGDDGTHYAFDMQKIAGETTHTWSFHGCENHDIAINTSMQDKTVRWIDRTLEGTHKVGQSPQTLVATWTMTREPREYPHNFSGGGVIKTVAAEQAVLGQRYDASLPPARVRATLIDCEGDTVMQGNPYSQAYSYCFPFLWVQRQAPSDGKASVYPAVYEWYRGDKPVVTKAEMVSRNPLTIRVTTASGQTDTYVLAGETFGVVSRDAGGVRYAQLNGGTSLNIDGVNLTAPKAAHEASITAIDYEKRTITLSADLPATSYAMIGNDTRQTYVELQGSGRTFSYAHDLLVHEGQVTSIKVTGEDAIEVQTSQRVFRGGEGNRKPAGFTVVTEDHAWAFRDGKVIHKPAGAKLSDKVFADANGDGTVNAKTYEIGVGDAVRLLSNVVITREGGSMAVSGNVTVAGTVDGKNVK